MRAQRSPIAGGNAAPRPVPRSIRWRFLVLILAAGTAMTSALGTTVSWVGASGDWNTPGNWNTGVPPGAADDVIIPAGPAITITHSSGHHAVRSLTSSPAFVLTGGSLTVATTWEARGGIILSGGSVLGGTLALAPDTRITVTANNGGIRNVHVIGDLDVGMSYDGAELVVTNGLVLDGRLLLGHASNGRNGLVTFQGSQRLDGQANVILGNSVCNSLRLGLPGTLLTLGPSVTISGLTGQIGYSQCERGPQNVGVRNEGLMAPLPGGALAFHAAWTNAGTLRATNVSLTVGGRFTRANLGTVDMKNVVFYVTGTVMNTGSDLRIQDLGGAWVLHGGQIVGGTVTTGDSGILAVGEAGGGLDGVTVRGLVDVGHAPLEDQGSRHLLVTNGLTLHGTLFLGNPTNNQTGALRFLGSQAVDGTGEIVLGRHDCNTIQCVLPGTVLRLGPGIRVRGDSGDLGYSVCLGGSTNVQLIMDGALSADTDGGIIRVGGQPGFNRGTLLIQPGARVDWSGNLGLHGDLAVAIQPGGGLRVGGHLLGSTTNRDQFVAHGDLVMPAGWHEMEALSADAGNRSGGYLQNFVLGNLILEANARVTLVDRSDNSAGPSPECVYVNALVTDRNSVLDLNGLRLYGRLLDVRGVITNGAVLQTPTGGGPIDPGLPTFGTITNRAAVNAHTFPSSAGHYATILVDPGSAAVMTPRLQFAEVQLIGPDGTILATATNSAAGQIIELRDVPLPVDGTYSVRVGLPSARPTFQGNYLITVWDIRPETSPLVFNERMNGTLESPLKIDQWTFAAGARESIRLQVLNPSTTGVRFELSGPGGWVGFKEVTSDSGPLTLPESGKYTLTARVSPGSPGGHYAFQLEQLAPSVIAVGGSTSGTFIAAGQARLFRVDVAVSGPLRFSCRMGTTNARVELYARFGAPPTRSTHEYRATDGAEPQSLVVPAAAAGTWYVLVYAVQIPQEITFILTAEQRPLLLGRVFPPTSDTDSETLLVLDGDGFTEATAVRLMGAHTNLVAEAVRVRSATELQVVFPAHSIPPGRYDICVTSSGATDCLPGAFTASLGGISNLQVRVVAPKAIGYHLPATVYVEYANVGVMSMAAPLLTVTATQNGRSAAMMTLDRSVVTADPTRNEANPALRPAVHLLASGRVPGLLQPGESCRVPVYYVGWRRPWDFAYPPIVFSTGIHRIENSESIDWDAFTAAHRPNGLSISSWTNLAATLQARIGQTWGGYVRLLGRMAELAGPVHGTAYDATTLFAMAVQQIRGHGSNAVSGQVIDIRTNQPVPQVRVVARQVLESGQTVLRATRSDDSGHFLLTNLPPGSYELTIEGYFDMAPVPILLVAGTPPPPVRLAVAPLPPSPPPRAPTPAPHELEPILTTDERGTAHLIWRRGSEVWHATHDGSQWTRSGPVPNAGGSDLRLIASTNLLDGVAPGILVAWASRGSNASTLSYSVGRPRGASTGWEFSRPASLHATNGLHRRGLTLARRREGDIAAVWQARHPSIPDDFDLYHTRIAPTGAQAQWLSSADAAAGDPGVRLQPADATGEVCLGSSWKTPGFAIPDWVPIVAGKYELELGAQWCRTSEGCELEWSGAGTAGLTTPLLKIDGELSSSASYKADSSTCTYAFDSAAAAFELSHSYKVAVAPWPSAMRKIKYFSGDIGYTVTVLGGGTAAWKAANSGYWPSEFSAHVGEQIGAYLEGKLSIPIPIVGSVEAEATGKALATVEIEMTKGPDSSLVFKPKVGVRLEVEGSVSLGDRSIDGSWSREYQYPEEPEDDEAGLAPATISPEPGITLTLNPARGTTNVHVGTPVLRDVVQNLAEDGPPALTTTSSGQTFLAWTLREGLPEGTSGNAVKVARWLGPDWAPRQTVPDSMGFNANVTVSDDGSGLPIVVWTKAPSAGLTANHTPQQFLAAIGSNDVFYSILRDNAWTTPLPLATLPGSENDLVLAKGEGSRPIVAWINRLEGTNRLLAAQWNGSTWTAPSLITTGAISGPLAVGSVAGKSTLFWAQVIDDPENPDAPARRLMFSRFESSLLAWTEPSVFSESPASFSASAASASAGQGWIPHVQSSIPPECCTTDPIDLTPPANPTCGECTSAHSAAVGSMDPNAKSTSGFGPQGFVPSEAPLPYLIQFENATNATAPAQVVHIRDPLSTGFDWSTFELSEIGFSHQIIPVPPGRQYHQTVIPLTNDGVRFDLEIQAGIDPATGEVYARFTSIDPETQLPPDITTGFLPPEDGTGRGQGHVAFFVRPKANLPTGAGITNVAFIQFDQNPVISTDQIDPHDASRGRDPNKMALITIDADSPSSRINPLPDPSASPTLSVCWSGADLGSGCQVADLYVSTNHGPWVLWQEKTTNRCATFLGQPGARYDFCSVAYDGAGNREAAPLLSKAGATIQPGGPTTPGLPTGRFAGLFFETGEVTHARSGYFSVQATRQGAFSGKLTIGKTNAPFKGQFGPDGVWSNVVTLKMPALALSVALAWTPSDPDRLRGIVSDGVWTAPLLGDRTVYDAKTNAAPWTGAYTLVVNGAADFGFEPPGASVASVKIDAAGKVSLKGTLADGTKFSQKASLGADGHWPLYIPLYGGGGSMLGWLNLTSAQHATATGQINWTKPPGQPGSLYPNGFNFDRPAGVYAYADPSPIAGTVTLRFEGGHLARPFAIVGTLNTAGQFTSLSSNALTLKINKDGLFTGTVAEPVSGRKLGFTGALLVPERTGAGFFLDTNRSGRVILELPPAPRP